MRVVARRFVISDKHQATRPMMFVNGICVVAPSCSAFLVVMGLLSKTEFVNNRPRADIRLSRSN